MKRGMSMSNKVCLWLGGGLVAVLLLGALGYAGWTNVGQWLERFAQEQEAQQAAREAEERQIHEINAQRLKDWEAYWKTPEGQEVKRKEAEARGSADSETGRGGDVETRMAEAARPSVWDGSVEVVKALVKVSANDPAGVTYNAWKTMSMGEDQQVTVVDFTVKNAFGGPVRHVWRVILDPRDGKVKGLHDGERWVVEPGREGDLQAPEERREEVNADELARNEVMKEAVSFIQKNLRHPETVKVNYSKSSTQGERHLVMIGFSAIDGNGSTVKQGWDFAFERGTNKLLMVLAEGVIIYNKNPIK